jgi:pSer/pThr/pTyr-binding forkhead associated (FHA) protein
MVTLTNDAPVWLVGRGSEDSNDSKQTRISLDDDVISPEHAEIKMMDIMGYKRVFIKDKESKHGTWVAGRRITNGQQVELKQGMMLTFGGQDSMLRGPIIFLIFDVQTNSKQILRSH